MKKLINWFTNLINPKPTVWWKCCVCSCWFSNKKNVQFHNPSGVNLLAISHGLCPDCKESQMQLVTDELKRITQ